MPELLISEIKDLAGWRRQSPGPRSSETISTQASRRTKRERRNEPGTNRERTGYGMRWAHGCHANKHGWRYPGTAGLP
jgi:hypothetical protein